MLTKSKIINHWYYTVPRYPVPHVCIIRFLLSVVADFLPAETTRKTKEHSTILWHRWMGRSFSVKFAKRGIGMCVSGIVSQLKKKKKTRDVGFIPSLHPNSRRKIKRFLPFVLSGKRFQKAPVLLVDVRRRNKRLWRIWRRGRREGMGKTENWW